MREPFVKPEKWSGAYDELEAAERCAERLRELEEERRQWEKRQRERDKQLYLKLD